MKLVKCQKNHYYDAEKYADCPHCAKVAGTEPVKSERRPVVAPPPPPSSQRPPQPAAPPDPNRTVSLWAAAPSAAPPEAGLACPQCGAPLPDDSIFCTECGTKLEPPAPEPFTAPPAAPQPSLQQAVYAVRGVDTSDMKTVAFYNAAPGADPVVGWLVAVKGVYYGESFPLKAGRNTIGRQMDNNVPLAQESTISRKAHTVLTFEPKQQTFFIQPGEGSGLTYLNGELVSVFTPLAPYGKLQLGAAEFVFVPLVGTEFDWERFPAEPSTK